MIGKRWRGIRRLIRQLELGLILVFTGKVGRRVEVAFHPLPYDRKKQGAKRRAVIEEIEGRSAEHNTGGVAGEKIVTVYRENAIHIACCLDELGPSSPKRLREFDTGAKTTSILYNNVYGWFERVDKGTYSISAQGRRELGTYQELAERYRSLVKAIAE
jgi:hypothetical protein